MSIRDPYEVVLADLRARRDELNDLIQSLEAFRPSQAPTPAASRAEAWEPSVPKRVEVVGPLFGLSIVDASKRVLEERGRPLAVGDIVAALKEGGHVMNSEDPSNTVSSVLNRAYQQGNGVVRIGRGVWGLAEWSEAETSPRATALVTTPIQPSANAWAPTSAPTLDDDIPF